MKCRIVPYVHFIFYFIVNEKILWLIFSDHETGNFIYLM
jgi:hypothetical protein